MEKQVALGALGALAQETRLDVFRLLVRAGGEGLSPGAIARALRVPAATLSFHLKELKSSGIVRCERSGRRLCYRPDYAAMNELLAFLTEQCCQGVAECRPAASRRRAP